MILNILFHVRKSGNELVMKLINITSIHVRREPSTIFWVLHNYEYNIDAYSFKDAS